MGEQCGECQSRYHATSQHADCLAYFLAAVRHHAGPPPVPPRDARIAELENKLVETKVWGLEAEVARLAVQLALVSGALCDAGSVQVEPYHEGIRALTRERDEARERVVERQEMVDHWAKVWKQQLDARDAARAEAEALRALVAEVLAGTWVIRSWRSDEALSWARRARKATERTEDAALVDNCPACGHAVSLHIAGHECAGTFYEGGRTCPCAEYQ